MQHYFHLVLHDPTLIHYSHFFYTWWCFRFTTRTPGIPCLLRSSALSSCFQATLQTVLALSMSLVIQRTQFLSRDPPVQVQGPLCLCYSTAAPLFHWDPLYLSGSYHVQEPQMPGGARAADRRKASRVALCSGVTCYWLLCGWSPRSHSLLTQSGIEDGAIPFLLGPFPLISSQKVLLLLLATYSRADEGPYCLCYVSRTWLGLWSKHLPFSQSLRGTFPNVPAIFHRHIPAQ